MFGLKINDPVHWRNSWSVTIGKRLNILNSTYNLFVFDEQTQKDELLKVLKGIPDEAYDLIRITPSESGAGEIYTDSGQRYRQN